MEPIIIYTTWFFEIFLSGFTGITIYPFIIIREDYWVNSSREYKERMVRHEMTHFRQQEEDGIIPFFWKYTGHYFKNKELGMTDMDAYENIPYEIEARNIEYNKIHYRDWRFYERKNYELPCEQDSCKNFILDRTLNRSFLF